MKKFEVKMVVHFSKTLHIEALDENSASVLAETMLLTTDALPLTDKDIVGLVTTATEMGKKPVQKADPIDEDEDDDDFCCGDCTICGLCAEDNTFGADETERIDELLLKLLDVLEDAVDAMDAALETAETLKEITGKDFLSQTMKESSEYLSSASMESIHE